MRALLVLSILATSLWLTTPVKAAEAGKITLNRQTREGLEEVYSLVDEKKRREAISLAQKLRDKVRENSPEHAFTSRVVGYLFLEQGNYRAAATALATSLKGKLPKELKVSTQIDLALALVELHELKKAGLVLTEVSLLPRLPAPTKMSLANAYHALGEKSNAATLAQEAISQSGRKAKRSWLLFLAGIYLDLARYKDAQMLLEQAQRRWPGDKRVWTFGAQASYLAGRERDAFAQLRTAYELGLLTSESEVLSLVSLGASADVPRKSLIILEDALKRGTVKRSEKRVLLHADLYATAREYEEAEAVLRAWLASHKSKKVSKKLAKLRSLSG